MLILSFIFKCQLSQLYPESLPVILQSQGTDITWHILGCKEPLKTETSGEANTDSRVS
jgi:hypothetical protein